jgi:hypothetical protein
MPTATTGALTQTLAQLRRRVAQRFGDYTGLTATSNGTTATFIDTINISTATENPVGREIVFEDGSKRRVSSWVDSTSTITFTPVLGATTYTASAKTAALYNKRGKGFLSAEYDAAINSAITDAFPLGLIQVTATVTGAFDESVPEITVPISMTHVRNLEWEDEEGFWHVVPAATSVNEYGWLADPAAGQLRLMGDPAFMIDGYNLRINGFGRQDVLSADTDACSLNPAYIENEAVFRLAMGGLDKDSNFYGPIANAAMSRLPSMRARIRTMGKGSLVRSV